MGSNVLVAVLNWCSAEQTLACVAAVQRSEGVEVEVLVVDNGSPDGSASRLAERLGRERVLALATNRGYAGGMNAALDHWRARSDPRPILLITPDALVEPEAIARMLRVLEERPEAGIVGPVVVYRREPRTVIGAGGVFELRRARASLLRTVRRPEPYTVDWIDGCCMLVRREALEAAGGFDERYFLYFEEIDLCCRVGQQGWKVVVAPHAAVWHDKTAVPAPYYFYYINRNRYLFWKKNFGLAPPKVAGAVAVDTARMLASCVRAFVAPRPGTRAAEEVRRLARQLRGGIAGTHDFLRGRLGPMPAVRR